MDDSERSVGDATKIDDSVGNLAIAWRDLSSFLAMEDINNPWIIPGI
jgi:hypothetical protein